ncbi:hypothetical protein [Haliangium sp.]|uniref:hypothetical protein n=1 Tax=Haliangium sp. TaxID=2663208 RepID=UPI003D0D4B30
MSKYPPYIQRDAGDVVSSDDWNQLQELIREEVRQHRHEGETNDTNLLGVLGTRIDNESLVEGAVGDDALADEAATAEILEDQAFADWAVAEEARIREQANLYFDVEAGHDHDGVTSSALAANSVGSAQLVDNAVSDDKLEQTLRDEITEFEALLAVPQALSVGSAAGSTDDKDSFVSIVGHGFGDAAGAVRLLKVVAGVPGEYSDAGLMEVVEWSNNAIRVRLPEEPTGLFQVEVDGLALNPLRFDEALVVTTATPRPQSLDADPSASIELEFSTELLIDTDTVNGEEGPTPLVLYPGEATPRPLELEPPAEGAPPLDQPIEVYYGDSAERLPGVLRLDVERKTVRFIATEQVLPWDTPVVIKVYSGQEQSQKPIFLAANNQQPMSGPATEVRFTTKKEPPKAPTRVSVRPVMGHWWFAREPRQISPADLISLANAHAVPIEIRTPPSLLPSDWIVVELSDGDQTVSEQVPAIGGGATVFVTLDARELDDGLLVLRAQARNTTSGSPWTDIDTVDLRTREPIDRILKDTRVPFVNIDPVRSPTSLSTQTLELDVEPGSTVVVEGGARYVRVVDASFSGRVKAEVPLNSNTANFLRISAVDPVGNRNGPITVDENGARLVIVHDDTVPQVTLSPYRKHTNRREVVLRGHANEPVSVTATNAGAIRSVSNGADGRFAVAIPLRPNQTNRIRLVATDSAGNTSPSVWATVYHDDQPPPLVLNNNGRQYSRFSRRGAQVQITVHNRGWVTLYGQTSVGAEVILSGHGHRRSVRAGSGGQFAVTLPFRLRPHNYHVRASTRTWNFELDAVDLAGNHTSQRQRVSVALEYQLPGDVLQNTYVNHWWWLRLIVHSGWFHDGAANRVVYYYTRHVVYYRHCYHRRRRFRLGWFSWTWGRERVCETRSRIEHRTFDLDAWLRSRGLA